MKKEMLINVLQPEEIRIAIVEDGVLEELYVERTGHESYVGNIYKGRIVNIEPSIQAAFVDFGVGRNGFLHVSDVEPAYYRHLESPHAGRRDDRSGGRRGDRRGGRPRPEESGYRREAARRPAEIPEPEESAELAARAADLESSFELPPELIPDTAEGLTIEDEAGVEEVGTSRPGGTAIVSESIEKREDAWDRDLTEDPATREAVAPAPEEIVEGPGSSEDEGTPAPAAEDERDETEEAAEPKGARVETKTKETRGKGRRRTTGRGKTVRKPRGERAKKEAVPEEVKAEQAAPAREPEPSAPGEERPRLMDSSERRTDESDPPTTPLEPRPAADISDEELSFSMARREESRPAAVDLPAPREPAAEPIRFEPTRVAPEPPDEEEVWQPEEPHGDESGPEVPAPEEGTRAEDARVIDFDEDYGPEFEEYEEQRERRGPGGPGRGDDRRRRGRRPMGRPGAGRPKPPIQDIFKRGQEVLVQVIKEGIGTKGPTLSTYISIAGRYLVLMPGLNRIGVSRKINDDEARRRLREILSELHPPKGLGFIIRTAGQDRNKKELQRDLAYLSRLWQVVVRRIRKTKSPCEIYQESDMVTRTIRDIFSGDIDTIWVDEPGAYEAAKEFLTIVMPRYANRIKFWDSSEPMFHKYGIEQEIARIQQRHVPLPHGGSIVIDQTEALVAIDVNSGNFRADNNAEETAYQINLQAAKEIARQLRLRDLGGVIVNDFIDMREEKHNRGVERALRDAVRRDRARTKILKISQFGIIEMTRQRIRPSLKRSVYQDCPHCHGTGQVKTVESMSIDVMRLLQLAVHRAHVLRIEVQVHENVAQYLLNRKRKEIYRLEEQGGKAVAIRSAGTSVSPEHLDFLCYDNNNNEVKFLPFEEPRPVRRGRG
jgi:ribonuclease E